MYSVFDNPNQEATEILDSDVEIPVSQEMKIIEVQESELVSAEKEVEIPVVSDENSLEITAFSEEIQSEIQVKVDENEVEIPVVSDVSSVKKYRVVFVLGGPGGGKSTQCAKISKQIGFTHLSSGDLLRKASQIDPENGYENPKSNNLLYETMQNWLTKFGNAYSLAMIQKMIKEGESVPPELTMVILMKAIENSGNDKFILDGFPRDEEIRTAFEFATKTEPELVLFFDCSEEEREKRILARNQGRKDDNPDSIRKRFKYFKEHTLPVVEYYRSKGKVYTIDASKTVEEVAATIENLLIKTMVEDEVVEEDVQAKMEILSI